MFRINSQSKYEEDFGLALEQESTAGHFTPGAIDGSYVVATKQYRTIISIHKRGAAAN